jgi:acetyltransferase-like isoleucine patch superfamily enzyme
MVLWDRAVAHCSTVFWTVKTRLLFAALGCTCGRGLCVDGSVVVRAPRRGAIRIGNHVRLVSRFQANLVGLTQPVVLQCLGQGRIEIGDNTGCSAGVFSSRSLIRVGRHVNIGGNVRIYDHDFHAIDWQDRRTGDPGRTEPVMIGDDVFIGANAILLKGVHVGDRSVIGAGSVVTLKDIPPDSVVAGNPARIVKTSPA